MNLINLKRAVRAVPLLGKLADRAYWLATGQYFSKKEGHGTAKYYIIRPPYFEVGLMTLLTNALGHIEYAKRKGYIPVVDYRTNTIYSGEMHDGTDNVWEWFFRQPGNISLEEAYQNPHILARLLPRDYNSEQIRKKFDLYSAVYSQFISFSDTAEHYIQDSCARLFPQGKRIMGTICRGSDYIQLKPVGHPVQPDVDSLIQTIQNRMADWKCDLIYLTTEEQAYVEKFQKAFPGIVITGNQTRVQNYHTDSGQLIGKYMIEKENTTKYQNALDYLVCTALLSKCDCFIGALSGCSEAALIMNNNRYAAKEIIDLGVYK